MWRALQAAGIYGIEAAAVPEACYYVCLLFFALWLRSCREREQSSSVDLQCS